MFTVALLGKTGAGKSTLLNVLFDLTLPTDNAKSCTSAVQWIPISSVNSGWPMTMVAVDVPGIGETLELDEVYLDLYKMAVPYIDHVIWVLQGDTRYHRMDETALMTLVKEKLLNVPFTVVINRIDDISPGDWNEEHNCPSVEQEEAIRQKVAFVRQLFAPIISIDTEDIIACSALKNYQVERLRTRIVERR